MSAAETISIPLSQLLLDPNNYRLQDQNNFVPIEAERFHLERVQEGTQQRLMRENIRSLRDSIVSNGYLDIERIIVSPYEHDDGKFLVLEGNRRIAALRKIGEEHEAGVLIPDSVLATLEAVPCFNVLENDDGGLFQKTLMGIRHVGGIKEWGGFQRAKLIADLVDDFELSHADAALKMGVSTHEALRRYRAYRTLRQMSQDDNFGEYASSNLYPLFHEAVSVPIVRDWLGWSADAFEFQNDETKEYFYELITPREVDDGEEGNKNRSPKITKHGEVRRLREIIPNQAAKDSLLNLDAEVSDALAIVDAELVNSRWRQELEEAIRALSQLPAGTLAELEDEELQVIERLSESARRTIEMASRLRS